MILYDVWALANMNSRAYRTVAKLPNGSDQPQTNVTNHEWVRIGRNVSEDEANYIMDQYPQAARAKC